MRGTLLGFDQISFGVLFGSAIRGRLRDDSDLDVGIHVDAEGALEVEAEREVPGEGDVQVALERATGRNIDLLVLNRAPATVCSAALLTGQSVLIREEQLYARYFLTVATRRRGSRRLTTWKKGHARDAEHEDLIRVANARMPFGKYAGRDPDVDTLRPTAVSHAVRLKAFARLISTARPGKCTNSKTDTITSTTPSSYLSSRLAYVLCHGRSHLAVDVVDGEDAAYRDPDDIGFNSRFDGAAINLVLDFGSELHGLPSILPELARLPEEASAWYHF